jgi:hypothetical protein
MRWFIVCMTLFALIHIHGEWKYEQGREDKHAEIMEYISGDRMARMAVFAQDKRTVYHKAGTCVACHQEG